MAREGWLVRSSGSFGVSDFLGSGAGKGQVVTGAPVLLLGNGIFLLGGVARPGGLVRSSGSSG